MTTTPSNKKFRLADQLESSVLMSLPGPSSVSLAETIAIGNDPYKKRGQLQSARQPFSLIKSLPSGGGEIPIADEEQDKQGDLRSSSSSRNEEFASRRRLVL